MTDSMEVDADEARFQAQADRDPGTGKISRPHEPRNQGAGERDRNRRMLGHLISSMGKIQKSTVERAQSEREQKRRDVEERVRRKIEEESRVAAEARELESDEDDRFTPARRIPKVYDDTDDHYLKTDTEPPIVYLPARLTRFEEQIILKQLDRQLP